MPGSIVFKPIQAKLVRDKEIVSKMDPYCTIKVGEQNLHSETSQKGGTHPHWHNSITMPLPTEQSTCFVEIKDDKFLSPDDNVGACELDIKELQTEGTIRKWYPLYHEENFTGEILMESTYMYEDPSGRLSPGITGGYSAFDEEEFSKEPLTRHEKNPHPFPTSTMHKTEKEEAIPMPMSETAFGEDQLGRPMKK
jgi:hypothetical protein